MPYRYFNRFLVLYPDFSGSRQISLFEFSSRSVVSHTAHLTGLFLHRRRLFIADHKYPAFDLSMMIHCRVLLTGSRLLHWNHSRQKGSVDPVSRINLTCSPLHLSRTEKSIFTELTMFENRYPDSNRNL